MNESQNISTPPQPPLVIPCCPSINFFNVDNVEFMKTKTDKYYDLAIVDPPYGINVAKMAYTQEENRPCKQKNGTTLRIKKLKYKHGDWDKMPPPQEYWEQLFRVSKNQIIWGIKHYDLKGLGNGLITWNKCVPEGVSFNNYEHAYCSLLDKEIEFTYMWAGMCQGKSLTEPATQQGNKQLNEKRIHPTHKPIRLYRWLISEFAQKGWKLLDTNGGGMSISIAADELNYDLDICEIDEDYFNAGVQRYETFKRQMRLF